MSEIAEGFIEFWSVMLWGFTSLAGAHVFGQFLVGVTFVAIIFVPFIWWTYRRGSGA